MQWGTPTEWTETHRRGPEVEGEGAAGLAWAWNKPKEGEPRRGQGLRALTPQPCSGLKEGPRVRHNLALCAPRKKWNGQQMDYAGPAPAGFSSASFCFLGAFGFAIEDSTLLFLLDFPVLDLAGKGKEAVCKIPHTPCTEVPNCTRFQDPGMPEEPSSKMELTGATRTLSHILRTTQCIHLVQDRQ